MKKFLNWLVYSSVDPDKISMTVHGTLVAIIPILIFVAHTLGFQWTNDQATVLVNDITSSVAAALILYGGVRKILITIRGLFTKKAVQSDQIQSE